MSAVMSSAQQEYERTAEVLEAAAARVERGWCQHAAATDAEGDRLQPLDAAAARFCALGAIKAEASAAARGLGEAYLATALDHNAALIAARQLAVSVGELELVKTGRHRHVVFTWNDANGRRAAEVAVMLRAAAARARAMAAEVQS